MFYISLAQLVKNPPAHAEDTTDVSSTSVLGRFPGEGNGNPLQYSCLENSMDKGAWRATAHGVTKSQRWLCITQHRTYFIVQFSSATQSCQTLCEPIDCSMPLFPVHHQLLEHAQAHVHWVGDNHFILCCPLLLLLSIFPSICFPMSWLFTSGGQSIGVSASASVLSMNIQEWFPSGLTGWIYLWSKGLSRVFSNTTVQKHQFFSTQLSL